MRVQNAIPLTWYRNAECHSRVHNQAAKSSSRWISGESPRVVVGGFRSRFISAGRGLSRDYYCCRFGDVILRGDLGRMGLKSRSHAIDSAYIEMKSRSGPIDRLHWGLSRAPSSGALLNRDSLSIHGLYLTLILALDFINPPRAISRSSITAEISCRAMRRNVGLLPRNYYWFWAVARKHNRYL